MLSVTRVCILTLVVSTTMIVCASIEPALAQMGSRSGFGDGGPQGQLGPQHQKRRYVPPRFPPTGPRINVAEVRLKGEHSVSESRIRSKLQTRTGRLYDPNTIQADVRQLLASGLCYDVRTYRQDTPEGVIITFELFEQPTIQYIKFVGATVREKTLIKKAELAVRQPLSRYRVEEAQRKLEEFYRGRGNSFAKITIREGTGEGDRGVAFHIEEGPRQRIRWTNVEGNTIASDARLRTKIDSKPGILWFFKGQVDNDVIAEDVDKLTSYYRSLGFFQAKVTKAMKFDKKQEWLTLTFHVDEGPRYVIRNISLEGNKVFSRKDLLTPTELREGDYFDLTKMNSDLRILKDAYGANGYIKVDAKAAPQFYEEPGQLDLVYKIDEGKQYRVGDIKVNLNGEYPHTRQTVVLNRIDMRQGDIVDIRKLRASERRLLSSQLFESGPTGGPEIAVLPRDTATRTAAKPASGRPF